MNTVKPPGLRKTGLYSGVVLLLS